MDQFLDTDDSQSLGCDEFCEGIRKMVGALLLTWIVFCFLSLSVMLVWGKINVWKFELTGFQPKNSRFRVRLCNHHPGRQALQFSWNSGSRTVRGCFQAPAKALRPTPGSTLARGTALLREIFIFFNITSTCSQRVCLLACCEWYSCKSIYTSIYWKNTHVLREQRLSLPA